MAAIALLVAAALLAVAGSVLLWGLGGGLLAGAFVLAAVGIDLARPGNG